MESDPDLPEEVDFSRGKRGSFLPEEPIRRAQALEERVRALQSFGLRLREAAEQVARSAEREGATYVVPESDMHGLLRVLGEEAKRAGSRPRTR